VHHLGGESNIKRERSPIRSVEDLKTRITKIPALPVALGRQIPRPTGELSTGVVAPTAHGNCVTRICDGDLETCGIIYLWRTYRKSLLVRRQGARTVASMDTETVRVLNRVGIVYTECTRI
jgi:hypothetical protein